MAKYQLMHSVRSHIGADDDAFNAIRQREDEDGIRGILLQRNVVPTAATALKTNIASLAPLVLPFTELVRRQLLSIANNSQSLSPGLIASGCMPGKSCISAAHGGSCWDCQAAYKVSLSKHTGGTPTQVALQLRSSVSTLPVSGCT